MPRPPENEKKYVQLRLSAMAWQIPISVAVGGGSGYWLQEWGGFAPWGLIVGVLFGMTAAFLDLYRLTQRAQALSGRDSQDGP